MASKVYFTKTITPEKVLEMYRLLGKDLKGNIAVKVHSGEAGNRNFLGPDMWKVIVDELDGTITECNAAYPGERATSEDHRKVLEKHGWTTTFEKVDLMDAEGPDMVLDVPDGKMIKKNYVGKDLAKYDSMLVLSHFKGHGMGGFGGALKQLSIGVASSYGKAYIHGAGDAELGFDAPQDDFLQAMGDAASSVVRHFNGEMAFINVMKNLSVDCDCDSNAGAPVMQDVGILASLDPVAIDQACVDIVYNSDDPGRDAMVERIESRNGLLTIETAAAHGIGSREYELIEVK